MKLYVKYFVPAMQKGPFISGPYPSHEEARYQYSDIFKYEGVQGVEIIGEAEAREHLRSDD